MFIKHIPVFNPCRALFAVQIGFPANLSMLAITLTAPPHCSQVSIFIPKTRLNLCAQVIDWCFCARVFFCHVGNACLVLFRFAGVGVTRCRLFGAGWWAAPREPPREGRPAQIRHESASD